MNGDGIEEPSNFLKQFMVHHQLWEAGKHQEAFDHLEGLIKKYPENGSLLETKAKFLIEIGRRKPAFELVEQAITMAPDDLSPYITKAELLMKDGLIKEGLEEMKAAINTKSGTFIMGIANAANLCRKYGFYEEAEEIYHKGFEKYPSDERIWHDYTKMYIDLVQLETYFEKLQEAVEKLPEDPHLWSRFTLMAGFLENEELSKKGIKNLAKYSKEDAFGYRTLATGYAAVNDFVNAEWAIRESMKLDETNGMTWVDYGSILRLMGQNEEGLRKYDKAASIADNWRQVTEVLRVLPPMLLDSFSFIQRDEGEKRVKNALAQTDAQKMFDLFAECYHFTRGDYLAFIANRDFPKQDDPDTPVLVLAMVFNVLKNRDKAIGILHRSVQRNPKNPDLWEQLGRSLIGNNGFAGAAQALMTVRELDSKERGITGLLGYSLGVLGELEKAVYLLEHALEVNPSDKLALQALPNFLMDIQRNNDAVRISEIGLKYYPDDIKLLGTLAIVAHAAGDKKKSKKALKQCKKLDKREGELVEATIKNMEVQKK